MDCFIKKIWLGNPDEKVHRQFVRFGRGKFENRAVLNLQKSAKIKFRGSFEWANDFVKIVSEINESAKFSGIIFSKNEITELSEFSMRKKTGIYEYNVSDLEARKISEIENRVYYMLLDSESETGDLKLKIKKHLPKPGKAGEKKTDYKFCSLESDLKYWTAIREAFMLPECKKCKISHTFTIEEIVVSEGEYREDFVKIRENAKRKGEITRKMEIDKQKKEEQKTFEI